ncbi:MAG: hypothetical protein WA417_24430 [Stellaceae bacterium]
MKPSHAAAVGAVPLALAMLVIQHSGLSAETKPDATMALNEQKTELSVQFPNAPATKVTLNTSEVDQMIRMLAQQRAEMTPPRPVADPAPGSTIDVANAGRWYVQPDGAGIDLDVLHPGYGWVGIRMDRNSIEELNRALARSIHPVALRAKHPYRRE